MSKSNSNTITLVLPITDLYIIIKKHKYLKKSCFIVLILAENFAETFLDGFCLPFPTQVEFTETTKLKEYEASCQCDQ